MPPRSPFDFDVSVSAAKQRQTRTRGMSGAFETSTRCCDWAGCEGRGTYRAPLAPDRLTEFRWFCLDHIRQYNASWNYFADCPEDELEARLRHAGIWERPTWKLGAAPRGPQGLHPHAEGRAWARWGFADPLEVLGDNATISPAKTTAQARPRRRLTSPERAALEVLSLEPETCTRTEARARYRQLVKELHPDMNGGENPDAERLTQVLRAWEVLRRSRNFDT
jgi:hypothetical protein